jgi:DNA polymerase-1
MQIETEITLVSTADEMTRMLTDLRMAEVIGLDVETTADIRWYQPGFKLLTIALSTREGHAYVIPCEHDQSYLDGVEVFKRVLANLRTHNPLWIMQNGSFDYLALKAKDLHIGLRWWDTQVAEYLITGDPQAKQSLVAIAKKYLGIDNWKDINYKAPEDEDLDMLARLNGRDADVTRRLFNPMSNEIDGHEDYSTLFHELMMPVVYKLTQMEERGMPVDWDRLSSLEEFTCARLEDTLAKLEKECERYGPWPKHAKRKTKTFNPGSFKQVGKVLYESLELPVPKFTDTGAPSTDAEALLKIEHLHPIVADIQEYRTLKKFHSSSLMPWMEHHTDGKLHPKFKPTQTRTGRLSSADPNIQQVPPEGRVIFGGVPGYKVVEIDYSQLELRIVAELAQEWTMLDAFHKDDDLHQVTAVLLGIDRPKAKTSNFGLLYGGGPGVLQREMKKAGIDISRMDAEYIRTKWFATYSDIANFHEETIKEAHRTGEVRSLIGRRRPLPDLRSSDWAKRGGAERQAINMPVQSLASDITIFQLQRMELVILGQELATPIAIIHDSILFLVPDTEHLQEDVELIQSEMEDLDAFNTTFGVDIAVPLKTDAKIGDYWA